MSAVFTVEFINEQIESLKAQLVANATAKIAARGTQSYSLETGMTRQSVMRAQLTSLASERKAILVELQYWEAQLCGTAVLRIVPEW